MRAKKGNLNRLSKRQIEACRRFAEGQLTNSQIASQIGVCERTVKYWRNNPLIMAEVERIIAEIRQAIAAESIANKKHRIAALTERWNQLQQIKSERAQDPEMSMVPGGSTGILVKQEKFVKVYAVSDDGAGGEVIEPTRQTRLVVGFTIDTALLRELRQLEKQIAVETGQWQRDDEGENVKPLIMVFEDDPPEDQ